jgi:hypothetical protein
VSKRLTDLDPRFVTDEGRRVGVSFRCPKCSGHRVAVNVDPPFDAGPTSPKPWRRSGDTFEDLTLQPSIVAHRSDLTGQGVECWHGFITNGQATP